MRIVKWPCPLAEEKGCTEEFCTKQSAKIHAERIQSADTHGSPGSIPHELMEFCTSSKRTFLTRLPWRGDIITHGVQTNNPPGFNPRMKLWVLCGGQEKCLRARSQVQVIMSRGVKMKDRDDQEYMVPEKKPPKIQILNEVNVLDGEALEISTFPG